MAEKPVSGNQLPENRDKKNFWTDSSTGNKIGVMGLLLAFIAIVTALADDEIRQWIGLREKAPEISQSVDSASKDTGMKTDGDGDGYVGDQVVAIDTTGQHARYNNMIKVIDDLLPKSTKGYEVFDKYIRRHDDCDAVAEAIKTNRSVVASLRTLVKNINEDDVLTSQSRFNIRPIKDLISEIDQWEDDYGLITDKTKSPCKMAMFPPMQYLMLRDDLIELKRELKERLAAKESGSNS
ncbi:hypothetical protein SAMN05216327_12719 [Dyadobacter sp. SG02]|uniref:hypothetical protein n=1 Tax=Dyadobacter sp. SG02 TaxID=1855291 RepID=UPI0008D2082D|nr:hypothetical protein [Dyadobacter sp. SG02]SEJ85595.1 hypothetical protein SAMN05216327_12719 [Dyadobacter sp. SG02]